MPVRARALSATLAALALGACAAAPDEAARIQAAHDAAVADLRAAQDAFAARDLQPAVLTFDDGTVVVDQPALLGPVGLERLRLRVSYVNTTSRILDDVTLRLAVVDGTGRVRERDDVLLQMPLHYRFTPGSSYTCHVEIGTGGAHRTLGWQWRLDCSAVTH